MTGPVGRWHAAAFVATFVGLAILLYLLNRSHAYHPTDDGFVLAYSWRIVNGEVPYRDFQYIRTPLTPYAHTVEILFADGWAIQAGRLAFYLELALAGALPAIWAVARLGHRASARAIALASAFFFLGVHNFPPMPWPTVDGLLLSSAAVTALLFSLDARGGTAIALRCAASVLLGLAVLAKQSYAPLALLVVAYAAIEAVRAREARLLVATVVPAMGVALGTAGALGLAGAFTEFAQQVVAPAQVEYGPASPWSGDFALVVLQPYLRALGPITLVFMVAAFSLGRWAGAGPFAGRLAALVLLTSVAAASVEAQFDVWTAGRRLFWVLLALVAGMLLSRERHTALGAAAVLVVAFCSSISFAYTTPLLGLVGAGVFVDRALARVDWPAGWLAVALASAIVVAGVIRLDLDVPYRDLPRAELVADLGAVYPRFGHLYTNPANAERFRELRELSLRHALNAGRSFVVMPDHPLIHYLSGTRNPLSIDWLQPQEHSAGGDRLAAELAERRPIVLIQRWPSLAIGAVEPAASCTHPPDVQELVREVAKTWVLVEETRHFCVFVAPARSETRIRDET